MIALLMIPTLLLAGVVNLFRSFKKHAGKTLAEACSRALLAVWAREVANG